MDSVIDVSEGGQSFSLSRKAASSALSVSTRTLDRYIKSGKLSTRIVDGRIWLDREELMSFRAGKERVYAPGIVDMSIVGASMDSDRIDSDTVNGFDDKPSQTAKLSTAKKVSPFKKLYEEIRDELREKQERLEVANYRVGQLEAQLRNCIPMLEYHKENYQRKKVEEDLKGQLSQASLVAKRLASSLKQQKILKRVFLAALVIVLALQPLWILIHLNNIL
jgi:hypothetical protein